MNHYYNKIGEHKVLFDIAASSPYILLNETK